MKVSQILETKMMGKGEYAGYNYDSVTKQLEYPDGTKVSADSPAEANKMSKAHKKASFSNPNVKTSLKTNPTTWGNKADYDIKSSGNGKIEVKFKPKGEKVTVFKGNARQVLKQMGSSGNKGALRGLARIGANSSKYAKHAGKILRGASFLGLGYVAVDTVQNFIAEKAAIRSVFENTIFAGSELDTNNPVYNKLVQYHLKAAAASIGTAVAGEMVQLIAAGKIAKFLKYARALQVGLASTGWGAIVAVLIFALTEGSMWLVSWWAKKYGAEWFQASAIEALGKDIDIPSETAPKVDTEEVKQEIENAAADSGDNVQDPTEAFKNWKKVQNGDISTTDFEF